MKKNKLGGKLFVKLVSDIFGAMFLLFATAGFVSMGLIAYVHGLLALSIFIGISAIVSFILFLMASKDVLKKADFADFVVAFLLLKSGCADEMKDDDASGEKQ